MGPVRQKRTKPESLVRSRLHHMGYRFRLHSAKLPGKPDIVLPRHQKVISVHGCFWHRHDCRRALPATNAELCVVHQFGGTDTEAGPAKLMHDRPPAAPYHSRFPVPPRLQRAVSG